MPWFGSWNSCIHCWAVCITGSRVETFSQSIQQWLFLFGKKSVNVLNPNAEYGNEQNKRESTAPNKTLWKDVRPMESGHWYQWYLNDGIKLLQCICAAKMNCNRQILYVCNITAIPMATWKSWGRKSGLFVPTGIVYSSWTTRQIGAELQQRTPERGYTKGLAENQFWRGDSKGRYVLIPAL